MSEEEKTGTEIGPSFLEELKRNPQYLARMAEAYRRLFEGKTPADLVKQRPGRGGGKQNYVDVGYMTEQANLVFGFAWTEEVLKEDKRKDKDGRIIEIGVMVKVSIDLSDGRVISKTQWGQKDVSRDRNSGEIISLYDDRKAAISDGVKKCLSYFGIAADVYAGKELELYEEEGTGEGGSGVGDLASTSKAQKRFITFMKSTGLAPSKAFKILGVKNITEIVDYKAAEQKLADALTKPEKEEVKPQELRDHSEEPY